MEKTLDAVVDKIQGKSDDEAPENTGTAIMLADGEIFKGGTVIATYTTAQENMGGTTSDIYKVYLPKGDLCAVVKAPTEAGKMTSVMTARDGRSTEYDTRNLQLIVQDLMNKGYL
ncbi:MAG: hypothetical protein AAF570_08045 [Bacteroidota bacterium]